MINYISIYFIYLSGLYLFFTRIIECWQYDIKKSDRVLDIGGGNRPFFRSSVVLDKFIYDDTERPTTGKLRKFPYKELVIGDCLQLPFKDKSIDFIYSRNLIDHVENVDTFISEIQRVAKRGVLICLSILNELFDSQPFHCWLISKDGDKLIFQGKTESIHEKEVTRFTNFVLKSRNAAILILFRYYYFRFFNVIYRWDGEIKYEIKGKPEIVRTRSNDTLFLKYTTKHSYIENIKKIIFDTLSTVFRRKT